MRCERFTGGEGRRDVCRADDRLAAARKRRRKLRFL